MADDSQVRDVRGRGSSLAFEGWCCVLCATHTDNNDNEANVALFMAKTSKKQMKQNLPSQMNADCAAQASSA